MVGAGGKSRPEGEVTADQRSHAEFHENIFVVLAERGRG